MSLAIYQGPRVVITWTSRRMWPTFSGTWYALDIGITAKCGYVRALGFEVMVRPALR